MQELPQYLNYSENTSEIIKQHRGSTSAYYTLLIIWDVHGDQTLEIIDS